MKFTKGRCVEIGDTQIILCHCQMDLQLWHKNALCTFRYLLVIEPVFRSSRRSARGRRAVRLPAEEAGQGSEVLRLRGLSDGQAGRPHGQRLAVSNSSSINSGLHVHFQAPSPCWPSPPARSTPPPTVCPPGRVQSSKVRISFSLAQTLKFEVLETLLK